MLSLEAVCVDARCEGLVGAVGDDEALLDPLVGHVEVTNLLVVRDDGADGGLGHSRGEFVDAVFHFLCSSCACFARTYPTITYCAYYV